MTNKKKKKRSWTPYQFFLLTVLLSLFLFFGLLGSVYRNNLKTTNSLASETISFLKDSCQRYDNTAMNATTESIQNVLGEALTLKNHIASSTLEDTSFLSQYASEQNLTGILVLDKNLNQDAAISLSGADAYTLWKNQIQNYNQNAFTEHPNKSLSDRITINSTAYDIAIVPRSDKEGIILCYKDTTQEKTDHYALTFESLLKNNTFYKNPRIIITDNKNVLTTNVSGLQNLASVDNSPILAHHSSIKWSADNLTRLKYNRKTWYGLREVYGKYYIYVFYSTDEIFSNMIPFTACAIAFYAILSFIMLLIRQHYQNISTLKEQKQLRTIEAISSLYSSTALVDLKEKRCEPIQLSPVLTDLLKGFRNADNMLQLILKHIISPQYQEGFAQFTDMDSLAERLKDKPYITYWYQSTSGVWYASYLLPERFDDDGNITVVLIANRDISAYKTEEELYKENLRKTAHDAEMANAAKTTFLRRMSHDIRTPINGIRGMVSIASRHMNEPEEIEKCLQKIHSSSDYLLDLVNDVLRMSKLESGKIILEKRPFNLQQIIAETISFIEVQAAEKHIHFHTSVPDITHTHLIGSPLHVRQIIQNIMSNAVKYTPAGGSIRISCCETNSTSDMATYSFICSDTGIGMSKDFQEHAFEPFVQEEISARTTYSGTGLGLSIVKDLVDKMDGQILLESTKDVGTTFTITLTFRIDPDYADSVPQPEDSVPDITGTKILLVEDNDLNMEIARSLLEEEGAIITEAYNGQEALQIFRDSAPGTFDLILMDIMMPVMGGLEASRNIRSLNHPDAHTIPIFAMTANAFVEDIQQSKEAGMNEHFSKPLDIPELVRAIYQYVAV